MTVETEPAAPATAAPEPGGLKAKANALGLALYLKAPPKAQNAILQGVVKAQPVLAKAKPYRNRALAAAGTLLVVRKVRRRKG
jgi:hypothetical protein